MQIIAIGDGTEVVIKSAGLILVGNPLDVVKIFELTRAGDNKMVRIDGARRAITLSPSHWLSVC